MKHKTLYFHVHVYFLEILKMTVHWPGFKCASEFYFQFQLKKVQFFMNDIFVHAFSLLSI